MRPHRPTRRRAHAGEDEGLVLGWARTAADLPEARQVTHDKLIKLMAGHRAGGVTWRQWTGKTAVKVMDALLPDVPTVAHGAYYRTIRAQLLNVEDSWLVIASAPAKRGHPDPKDPNRKAL